MHENANLICIEEVGMSFGLEDKDWVDPPDEPEHACQDCDFWRECPCGDHGWCIENGEFTEPDDGC